MTLFLKRAIKDILKNRYLNTITIITIALSILIVSAFALFFLNVGDLMNTWKKGIRIMAYLDPGVQEAEILHLRDAISKLPGVLNARFISKDEALLILREQVKGQSSLLDDLETNPLPSAFEIQHEALGLSDVKIARLADRIASLPSVREVEYGQKWLGRFTHLFNLFRFAGFGLGGLFFMATVFIVANTIRLVLYSRREEMEIMRLVGATDRFIKTPFYIEGLIQGFLGGIIGLAGLYIAFAIVSSKVGQGLSPVILSIRFLPLEIVAGILLCSMIIGWLGCFLSLKQFFKKQ